MAFLRIDNPVGIFFGSEIALESEEEDGELVLKGSLEFFGPLFGGLVLFLWFLWCGCGSFCLSQVLFCV